MVPAIYTSYFFFSFFFYCIFLVLFILIFFPSFAAVLKLGKPNKGQAVLVLEKTYVPELKVF